MRRLLPILFWLLFPTLAAWGDERILAFDSEILVLEDGSMQVTETIQVRAEGRQIRQGIYRDFPTDYTDRYGNRYRVDFEVLEVRRDGAAEGYFSRPQGNGVRTYLGRKGSFLAPGDYRYQMTYRTNRQLGFFPEHDELYWNVTGNGWEFPIDRVTARVLLPVEIPISVLAAEGYTGPQGSQGQDYRSRIEKPGEVSFATTRPLAAREGLTIVVSWPKGYLAAPTLQDQAADLLRDNRAWLVAVVGLLLTTSYYLLVWLRVGRDPRAGVVIPRYLPPKNFSPASSRFIRRMGYDHKAFTVALINLAVKGLVRIREAADGFSLERTAQPAQELAAGEKALLKALFAGQLNEPAGVLKLERANHRQLRKALQAHKTSLRRDYEKRFFVSNRGWLLPGLLLSLLIYGLVLLNLGGERMAIGGFMSAWLGGWTLGVLMLLRKLLVAWRRARGGLEVFGALVLSAFALPFIGGELAGIYLLATQASPALPVVLLLTIGLNLLFYQLLKAPTLAGRILLDQLAGFRDYLAVAERDELNLRNPPDKTPQLFEAYLPYALALDVEQPWADKFSAMLADLGSQGQTYRPGWYQGDRWRTGDLGAFAGSLGSSLSSAVSSSSTAPGSSSGSGGGGSSGGGGGGGGGGGW